MHRIFLLLLIAVSALLPNTGSLLAQPPNQQQRDYINQRNEEKRTDRIREEIYQNRISEIRNRPSSVGSVNSSATAADYGISEESAQLMMGLFRPWVHHRYGPQYTNSSMHIVGFGWQGGGNNKHSSSIWNLYYQRQMGSSWVFPTASFQFGTLKGDTLQEQGIKKLGFSGATAGLMFWLPRGSNNKSTWLNGIQLGIYGGVIGEKPKGTDFERHIAAQYKAELGFVTPSLKTWKVAGNYFAASPYHEAFWNIDLGVAFTIAFSKQDGKWKEL